MSLKNFTLSLTFFILFLTHSFSVEASSKPSDLAIPYLNDGAVIFKTGFEEGDSDVGAGLHSISTDESRNGNRALTGKKSGVKETLKLEIPFEVKSTDALLKLTFWIKANGPASCQVNVGTNVERIRKSVSIAQVPREWTEVISYLKPFCAGKGIFVIQAGGLWIDDLRLTRFEQVPFDRPDVEDYPALAADAAGDLWLAVQVRSLEEKEIRVYKVTGGKRRLTAAFAPKGLTGLGSPVLTSHSDGCSLAFSGELDGKWRIAYARLNGEGVHDGALRYIATDGLVNVHPAIASHEEKALLTWESNSGEKRGIYSAMIAGEESFTPVRISDLDSVSRNPAVVNVKEDVFFAAWDSVRDGGAHLYGAWYRKGRWTQEFRITNDPRVERHVSLAVQDGEVWMAWQADYFDKHFVNGIDHQSIVVAKLYGTRLEMPRNFFRDVARPEYLLMQPAISFDKNNTLWVTARRSTGLQTGWLPLSWRYDGSSWTGPRELWRGEGRTRPAVMAWNDGGGVAAIQRDKTPRAWGTIEGTANWKSEIELVSVDSSRKPSRGMMTVNLQMPKTNFVLKDRIDNSAALLPRQQVQHNNETLTLYWGDLHEHSHISTCQRYRNPSPGDLYANQRDIEKLDFTAITDHGFSISSYHWQVLAETARNHHDAGQFVPFLGLEWTSDQVKYNPPKPYKGYGHRNLIFLNPAFPQHLVGRNKTTPQDMWDQLKGAEYVTIPHQLADTGNCPTDWSYANEKLQPLAEIYQQRESYEYLGAPRQAKNALKSKGHFLQDAWAEKIIIGVIASPDHGGGHGKAGVWAKELTRESLFEAFRARHTYGTSDPKIMLFFSSGDAMMGDKVERRGNGPIEFHIRARSLRKFDELVVFRNNEQVLRTAPKAKEIDLKWTDEEPLREDFVWYYVRLQTDNGELAWASPIWFIKP
ncbi:DUF3604 domain-containing protein [Candidatus Hydrogenedentota bacterium]